MWSPIRELRPQGLLKTVISSQYVFSFHIYSHFIHNILHQNSTSTAASSASSSSASATATANAAAVMAIAVLGCNVNLLFLIFHLLICRSLWDELCAGNIHILHCVVLYQAHARLRRGTGRDRIYLSLQLFISLCSSFVRSSLFHCIFHLMELCNNAGSDGMRWNRGEWNGRNLSRIETMIRFSRIWCV